MLPPPHTRLPSPAPPPPTRTWIFYISASRRPPHLHSVRLILRLSEFASLPHFLAHTHARAPIHKTRPSPRAAQQRPGSRQTVTIATSCRCFFPPFFPRLLLSFFFFNDGGGCSACEPVYLLQSATARRFKWKRCLRMAAEWQLCACARACACIWGVCSGKSGFSRPIND